MAQPRIAFFKNDFGLYPALVDQAGNPVEGSRAIRAFIDVSSTVQTVDFGTLLNEDILTNVQAIFIDNSDGTNPLTIESSLTGHRVIVPGGWQYVGPFLFANDQKMLASRSDSGVVRVFLFNMPHPVAAWPSSPAASGAAVTIADGADVALGATGDAAITNPALSGTVIAFLKGLLTQLQTGEAVTIADGADVAQGAKADAAITNPASSGSVVAFLKGILTILIGGSVTSLGTKTTVNSPAVNIASDQVAVATKAAVSTFVDGSIVSVGAIADAAVTSSASSASVIAALKGILSRMATQLAAALGQTTMSASMPVVIASDQSVLPVVEKCSAGANTSVAGATSNTVILASNANRRGAIITNEQTDATTLKLALGFTSSATAYTYLLQAGATVEIPYGFTGAINGIWSAANGNARVTELT